MDFSKVEDKLGDWGPKLRPFIESKEFDDIFEFLKHKARRPPEGEGRIICPQWHDTFRSFKETPYKDLKAVFILQDPYPWIKKGIYVADGIPMSCRNTGELQPSLSLFYEGIEENIGNKVGRCPDLTYLCNQGILILNTSLTVELNKPSSHTGVWDSFMAYLIQDVLNIYNRGLVCVSFGKSAHVTAKDIVPFLHWTFEIEHPAAAAHKMRKWFHQDIFTKINKLLMECNSETIIWDHNEYKQRHTKVKSGTEMDAERLGGSDS